MFFFSTGIRNLTSVSESMSLYNLPLPYKLKSSFRSKKMIERASLKKEKVTDELKESAESYNK